MADNQNQLNKNTKDKAVVSMTKSEAKNNSTESSTNMKKLMSKVGSKTSAIVFWVLVLVVVGVAGYILLMKLSEEPSVPVTIDSVYQEASETEPELTYSQRASQLAFYDDYEGAQKLLEDGANNTQDNVVAEAEFYVEKTLLALNNGYTADALAFAIYADEVNPTVSSAALAATAAELLEDNQTAIYYFQLAADRTPQEERDYGPNVSEYYYYINRIEQLGGTNEN